jgi:thioredoxin 1
MGSDLNPIPGLVADKLVKGWQTPSAAFAIMAALAALVSGLWFSVSSSTTVPKLGSVSTRETVPDAVQQTLSIGKPTVIEFGANSCVSCREMKPVLRVLAQDRRIAVADIDILKERHYISRYQIRLMPTQVFYDANGKETGRHMGKISGEEIMVRLGIDDPAVATPITTPKAPL